MKRTRIRKALEWTICAALILFVPVLTLPKVWNNLYLHTHHSRYQRIELPILSVKSKVISNYNAGSRYGGGRWTNHELQWFTISDPHTSEPQAVFIPEADTHNIGGAPRTVPLLFNPAVPSKPLPETSLRFVHPDDWPSGWATTGLILLNLLVAAVVACNLVWNNQQSASAPRSRGAPTPKNS